MDLRAPLATTRRYAGKANWYAAKAGMALLCISVVAALLGVFVRSVGEHLGITEAATPLLELQWNCFSASVLLSAPYTYRVGGHVSIDLWASRASEGARRKVERFLILPCVLISCFLLLYISVPPAIVSAMSLESSSSPGGLPRYPLKILLVVSLILFCLEVVLVEDDGDDHH